MTSSESFLDAGEVVSTHGISGEVKILPWADEPAFLLQFDRFYLGQTPYTVESARVHKTCVLAKLCGIDTPEAAMLLRGKTVRIERDKAELPEGRVFISDLLGCRVLDDEGNDIGKIEDVLTLPASDVYVIQGARRYLIPAVKEFVREIDTSNGVVRVHLIEGFATDEN